MYGVVVFVDAFYALSYAGGAPASNRTFICLQVADMSVKPCKCKVAQEVLNFYGIQLAQASANTLNTKFRKSFMHLNL